MTGRIRKRWKREGKIRSTWTVTKPVSQAAVFVYNTYADSAYEEMADHVENPWPPRPRTRFKMTRNGLQKIRYPPFAPIHTLAYSCLNRYEASGKVSWDYGNGSSHANLSGHITQMLYYSTFGDGVGGPKNGWINTNPSDYNYNGMVLLAKQKCISRWDRPTESFGEPVAELGKTLNFISDPLDRVRQLTASFNYKARRILSRTNSIRSARLAKLWMQYSFATAPLWRTVDDAVNLFRNNLIVNYGTIQSDSSQVTYEGPTQFRIDNYSASGWTIQQRITRRLKVQVRATILSLRKDVNDFATHVGGRARDVPTTLWELFPLSFMVDRVVNVKATLAAATSLSSLNVKVLGACITSRIDIRSTGEFQRITAGSPNFFTPNSTNPFYYELFTYNRTLWEPGIADATGSQLGSGVFRNLSTTLDALSLVISDLTRTR